MVFLGGSVASGIISHLPEHNIVPLSTMIFIQTVIVLTIYFGTKVRSTTSTQGNSK